MENYKQQRIVWLLLICSGLLSILIAYVDIIHFQLREKTSVPFPGIIILALGIGKLWRMNQLKKNA